MRTFKASGAARWRDYAIIWWVVQDTFRKWGKTMIAVSFVAFCSGIILLWVLIREFWFYGLIAVILLVGIKMIRCNDPRPPSAPVPWDDDYNPQDDDIPY